MKKTDLVGLVVGRLTVVGFAGKGDHSKSLWLCRCACGGETVRSTSNLNKGGDQSCGCTSHTGNLRHGMKDTPEYRTWCAIKRRCNSPSDTSYPRYGALGVRVCEAWENSFEQFFADMGPRPDGTSIDRIDSSKGYSPENCRWATTHEQSRNKKNNVWITISGETKVMFDWARVFGISPGTVISRMRSGWDPVRAVTTPVRGS
jgi:hypothetical protein